MSLDEATAWQAMLDAAGRGAHPVAHSVDDPGFGDRLAPAADSLWRALGPVARAGRRFVIGQIGQSLDGRICTESGDSHYINGEAALVHLHRLRALVDCVLVGVGTVIADRPRLTVRRVAGPDPVRAVLDPNGRAPMDASPFAPARGQPPTLHLVCDDAAERLAEPAGHVRRLSLGPCGSDVAPAVILDALDRAGCGRVLVEGGSHTLSRFYAAGALDRLHVLVAPLLIGSGRPGLVLPPVRRLRDARRPAMRTHPLGDDVLFDLDLAAEARR